MLNLPSEHITGTTLAWPLGSAAGGAIGRGFHDSQYFEGCIHELIVIASPTYNDLAILDRYLGF